MISLRAHWAALAATVLLSLGVAVPAHAEDDPPGRVGRVAELFGHGWMYDTDQREWADLRRNRPFTSGDRIATDRDSRMELQIGSTTVRLDERSELLVSRLDDDRIDLQLINGRAAVRLRQPEVIREFSLQSGDLRFEPRSTGFFRVDRSDRGTTAGVLSGELMVASRDISLNLRTGQQAELFVPPGERRLQNSWTRLPDDDFERWVRSEDAQDQPRYERYSGRSAPVPVEMTGAADLDRYGEWDNHPEYGPIWTPRAVVAGWAPYRYGHWTWMVRWGWTWMDDAPWGYAPFHYGRWVNWGGRWCWAPGPYVPRPVYAPAMVAWVGGPQVSVSVSVGTGPTVGWIPLAPREVYRPVYVVSPAYERRINIGDGRWLVDGREPVRPEPGRPVMYTNQGVPGGVTMVPSNVLTGRQPVSQAPRVADEAVGRAIRDREVGVAAPPPAPGRAAQAPVNSWFGKAGAVVQPIQAAPTPSPINGQAPINSQGHSPVQPVMAPPSERGRDLNGRDLNGRDLNGRDEPNGRRDIGRVEPIRSAGPGESDRMERIWRGSDRPVERQVERQPERPVERTVDRQPETRPVERTLPREEPMRRALPMPSTPREPAREGPREGGREGSRDGGKDRRGDPRKVD